MLDAMAVVYSVKMAIPGFVVSHKSMSPTSALCGTKQ